MGAMWIDACDVGDTAWVDVLGLTALICVLSLSVLSMDFTGMGTVVEEGGEERCGEVSTWVSNGSRLGSRSEF